MRGSNCQNENCPVPFAYFPLYLFDSVACTLIFLLIGLPQKRLCFTRRFQYMNNKSPCHKGAQLVLAI